ncbi:MAG: McrC family protein [Bacteroidales bacterium]|nr:McrC family protein [Bacteroidales bacterium]
MSRLRITDNHDWIHFQKVGQDASKADLKNLERIADVPISRLSLDDNPNLLLFPRDFYSCEDKISESQIISLQDENVKTGNIMGFVGVNETQLDICSRFDKQNTDDYFLHYMLQKVFSINLFDIKHSLSKEPVFDFLLYLFPHFLKKALAQGLFKKYKRNEYNDANLKGPIDISRHLRQNIPFRGTIAYSAREHSYDNEVTQLVRHTIEYIKQKEQGRIILTNDDETRNCGSQITMATPSYSCQNRQRVINDNLRPLKHPYFTEYTHLQRLCLQILRHEAIKFGQEKDKVYGVLFDGAWLWEEYLSTILKPLKFKHPQNKKSKGGLPMFVEPQNGDAFADGEQIDRNSRKLYPDFWKDNYIIDAKYKHLNQGVSREDLYQVVTYMYCKQAKNGGYIYPFEQQSKPQKFRLKGYEGTLSVIPFYVPQSAQSWKDFMNVIHDSEKQLRMVF